MERKKVFLWLKWFERCCFFATKSYEPIFQSSLLFLFVLRFPSRFPATWRIIPVSHMVIVFVPKTWGCQPLPNGQTGVVNSSVYINKYSIYVYMLQLYHSGCMFLHEWWIQIRNACIVVVHDWFITLFYFHQIIQWMNVFKKTHGRIPVPRDPGSPNMRMVMEPKYLSFRFGDYTPQSSSDVRWLDP